MSLHRLINRSMLARFRVTPRPANFAESMAIFARVQVAVGNNGKIIHYNQAMCPVTKERLEQLNVLLEDFDAEPYRVDAVVRGETVVGKLSPLEQQLVDQFSSGRVILNWISRDPASIKASELPSEVGQ